MNNGRVFITLKPRDQRSASADQLIARWRPQLAKVQGAGRLELPNTNFDTGEPSGPGKYRLDDETHAVLLNDLAKEDFAGASPEVRTELLNFYGDPNAPYATKTKPKEWARVQAELQKLRQAPPASAQVTISALP